ncbi:MAG TPA: signal peptide peptidase SppA [Candidatus Tectomicrobia bacterium]|nr:signal peptide peptidase SppA [Candidatus Tectomicrobia bacterium]
MPGRTQATNPSAVIVEALVNVARWLRNAFAGFSAGPDFVLIEIAGRLPEQRVRPQGWRGWLQRRFSPPQESLESWRERLRWLANDPRVKGVIVTLGDLQAELPALESLRRSLLAFRTSGKRLIAFLFTANLRMYYLASAADTLVAPESAEFALHGLRTEATFLRAALDQFGVQPQFHHIAEYKSAANRLLYAAMPETQREMLTSLLDSTFEDIVGAIASARHRPVEAIRDAIDQGLISAAEARERGLLDLIAFEDELSTSLSQDGKAVGIHGWDRASLRVRRPYHWRSLEPRAIGIVQLVGAIVPGKSRDLPLPLPQLGRQLAGHETIAQALRRAESSPRVKAIVFHVESPGGSAIASDLIWHEVSRVQRQKPVVVYMGNVAASGGYYVACGARHIVAGATTLTGSIGVIAGKINWRGLFEKVRVHREIVGRGATAAMPSTFESYSDHEWELLRRWMEEIYQRFKARVAAGRGRSLEAIEEVARGRVWTGRQALGLGLIDEIGDFETAVDRAKELAEIPLDADVPVMIMRPTTTVPWPSVSPAAWEQGLGSLRRLRTEHALVLMEPEMRIY